MITGLRTNCHSVQSVYKLRPNITTLGKCFGGGMPIGIIAIKRNIEKKLNEKNLKFFLGNFFWKFY